MMVESNITVDGTKFRARTKQAREMCERCEAEGIKRFAAHYLTGVPRRFNVALLVGGYDCVIAVCEECWNELNELWNATLPEPPVFA